MTALMFWFEKHRASVGVVAQFQPFDLVLEVLIKSHYCQLVSHIQQQVKN